MFILFPKKTNTLKYEKNSKIAISTSKKKFFILIMKEFGYG